MGAKDIVITEHGIPRPGPLGVALAILLLTLVLALGAQPAFGASYVVDRTDDASVTTCNGAANNCTLRGAISNAAASGAADTITFDPAVFPSATPATISLGSALPNLSSGNDTIDGSGAGVRVNGVTDTFVCFTLNSNGNTIRGIELITNCSIGITITGASNTIGGVAAVDRNVVSGNGPDPGGNGDGIRIDGAGATGNAIRGNYVGTNEAGTAAMGNTLLGIRIIGAAGNTIGGTAAGDRNVVSGNLVGVSMEGPGATGNVILGNYIGTDVSGSLDLGNALEGVAIVAPAASNTVGGAAAGARNIISGNNGDGVSVGGPTNGNIVKGNYIGTNAAGTAAVANSLRGVRILAGATGNTVGGSAVADRNVISGNPIGVLITGSGSNNNAVAGNYIGTNVAGDGAIANTSYGVLINSGAAGNTVGGTTVADRNVISGNGGDGVAVTGSGNTVAGNYIGTNSAGTGALANVDDGVEVSNGATGNTIGGSGVVQVVSGNGDEGIEIVGSGTNSNVVKNNYVGLNAAGTSSVANFEAGIKIGNAAAGNTIGGSSAGDRNVISGNTDTASGASAGVDIFGATTSGNVIKGNYIGTNAAGTLAVANNHGIVVSSGPGNTIGGSVGVTPGGNCTGECNLISGNDFSGVYVYPGAGAVTLKGNYVGTDVTGGSDLGNAIVGVWVSSANGAVIGGSAAGEGNIISGNGGDGVQLMSADGAVVRGNYIGTNPNGAALGNTANGVEVQSLSDSGTIGGTAAGTANTIAYNGQDGLVVRDGSANSIRGNSIYANSGLGIDLDPNGVTANDAGDGDTGANNLMNFPVITSASFDGVQTTISGTLDSAAPGPVQIDVYANDVADLSDHGEGRLYLGSTTVAAGAWTLVLNGQPAFPRLTATATDTGGNTSEFSHEALLTSGLPPGEPVVTQGPIAGATAPGTGGGTFGNQFDLEINSDGAAVFANTVTGGSASAGVFLFFAGTPVDDIALQGQASPAGGTFTNFGPPVNNDLNQIVSHAQASGGPADGLYLFFAGSPTNCAASGATVASEGWCAKKQAATSDGIAEGGGAYNIFGDPVINNVGQIAATASTVGGSQGLFLFFAGSPVNTAQTQAVVGNAAPGGGSFLFFAGSPAINNNGRIAQKVELTPGGTDQGLYLFFAGDPVSTAQKIARTNDPVPGGGNFLFFAGSPTLNNDGRVVAVANYTQGTEKTGLFLFFAGTPTDCSAVGGIVVSAGWCGQKLADLTTPAPAPFSGTLANYSSPALTDGVTPQAVARAKTGGGSGPEGLFLFFAGSPVKTIVAQGDDVPNTDPDDTFNGASPVFPFHAMNNEVQVVFVGKIQDNATTNQGVFIASLDSDNDGMLDYLDNCPTLTNTNQGNIDSSLAAAGASVLGDGLGNACDTDDDNDQFSDILEASFAGTNPVDNCPIGPGSGGDAWPADINSDGTITFGDIGLLTSIFGSTVPPQPPRRDIAPDPPDGAITFSDVGRLTAKFGQGCN